MRYLRKESLCLPGFRRVFAPKYSGNNAGTEKDFAADRKKPSYI